MKKGDHLFLVDGSAYIFRAYHALPPLTRKSDGVPVGAVAGYCNMMWKLLQDARNTSVGITPTHFAVIFDHSSKTFRNEIFPEYKANREAPPEDLRPQFALIREATQAFNVPSIEKEGFEADDIIATYAKQAAEQGADVTIISSDKDLMQLINKNVCMYDQMKDRQIYEEQVMEKFGVSPEKMIDLQALSGDSTDNIPGVPGIGPKTAALLLEEFGTLENLLENAHTIKQNKRRENLIEFAELARISKQLVTLDNSVELDMPLDALSLEPIDGKPLISYLKAMEFTTLTKRVASAVDADADAIDAQEIDVEGFEQRGPDLDLNDGQNAHEVGEGEMPYQAKHLVQMRTELIKQQPIDINQYECIQTEDDLDRWINLCFEKAIFAVDTETTSLDPMQAELVGISLSVEEGKACYIPLAHKSGVEDLLGGGAVENQLSERLVLEKLKPLLEAPHVLKIAQNMKYDWLILNQRNIEVFPFDDTMLISYVLDAGRNKHGMDALAEKWLEHECISYKELTGTGKNKITFDQVPLDEATKYAAEDADVTFRLWQILKPRLVAEKLTTIYERLERPLVKILAQMEQRGVEVDQQILSRLSGELAQSAARLEDEIYELAGEKFNIASPKQMGDILFGKLGLPGAKKTKTGAWSTAAGTLEDLAAEGHDLPKLLIEWRQLSKLKSTYTDALPEFINPTTKRIHTSYSMASTTTGRLSSSDPNLQNIPVRRAEGRKIRTAFVAPQGYKLVSADYSQIELRVLAHVAEIPELKQAFADGIDIHAKTASEMFNVPIDGMDPMIRRQAKAINFGIIYGISAFGLAAQLGISRGEASDYMKLYFERFPRIKTYMEETKAYCLDKGYVETIFGRQVHYPEINSKNHQMKAFNERAAINAPIQGSAADIIRRAMINMEDQLEQNNLSAKMLLQVHDELIFEVLDEEIEKTIDVVKRVMIDAPMPALALSVPLQVDAQAAQNWDEAH